MFGLEAKVVWLLVYAALYWSYCISGVLGSKTVKDRGDFSAGRSISIWVFVLVATATSFSGGLSWGIQD